MYAVCLANVHIEPVSAAASMSGEHPDRAMALQREVLASREASLAQREQVVTKLSYICFGFCHAEVVVCVMQELERVRSTRVSEWESQERRVQDVLRLQSDVESASRSISSRLKDAEGRERAVAKKEHALQQQFESSKAEILRAFEELETTKRALATTSKELLQKEAVIQRASLEVHVRLVCIFDLT